MPGTCKYPQSPGDDSVGTYESDLYYHYEMVFRPNCLAHPTESGQQALATLLKPSLPLT